MTRTTTMLGVATLTSALLALTACSGGADENTAGSEDESGASNAKVCVDQYTTATVIDDILEGLTETLEAADPSITIDIKNPQADVGTEQTIAQQFLTSGCDAIVAVGTAAAQIHANAGNEVPMIFAGSSTPVEAGLVESMEAPGGNVTGVADIINPAPDIDAMMELMPDLSTVGLIWKLGDPAGDAQTARAMEHLDEVGIDYIEATITNGGEVTQAAQSLVSKVDAIEIPGDTTTLSSIAGVITVADDAGLPVFGGTSEVVEAGGVLSSTYVYSVVGEETAHLVLDVLNGANPGELPVVVPDVFGLDLNEAQLERHGLELTDNVRELSEQ